MSAAVAAATAVLVDGDPVGSTPHELRLLPAGGGEVMREAERQTNPFEQKTIDELYDMVLSGEVPRHRALKQGEPEVLSVQHLNWISLRAMGFTPGRIQLLEAAQGREVTLNRISVILHHPDAEWMIARLASYRATGQISSTNEWLADVAGEAREVTLHHMRNVSKPELSAKTALELLKLRYATEQAETPRGPAQVAFAPGEVSRLAGAITQANRLREIGYKRVEVLPADAAGGLTALPSPSGSPGQPPSQAPAVVSPEDGTSEDA